MIGSTEHAAAQLLPGSPGRSRSPFRATGSGSGSIGAAAAVALTDGRIDLALLLGPADEPDARIVGELALTWFPRPAGRRRPAGHPAGRLRRPCVLRTRAWKRSRRAAFAPRWVARRRTWRGAGRRPGWSRRGPHGDARAVPEGSIVATTCQLRSPSRCPCGHAEDAVHSRGERGGLATRSARGTPPGRSLIGQSVLPVVGPCGWLGNRAHR